MATLKSSFFRSIAVLVGGTAIAQAISIAILPIITRLYSPADYSLYAVYVAIVQIVSVGAALRFDVALNVPKRDVEAIGLLILGLISSVIISGVSAILIAFFSNTVAEGLGRPDIEPYLWLVPCGIVVASWYSLFQYWAARTKNFTLISRTRITQSVSSGGIQIGVGLISPSPIGLLLGHLLQTGAGIASLVQKFVKTDARRMRLLRARRLRALFIRYRAFPLYSVAEATAQIGSLQLPLIIIAACAVGPEAGFLTLATRVSQAPIALLGGAVAQVFASNAGAALRAGNLRDLVLRTQRALIKSAVGPMLFMALLSPSVCGLLFGDSWRRSGELIQWVMPGLIMQMLASAIGPIFYIKALQQRAFSLQIFGLIFRVSAVAAAALLYKEWIAEVYAITGALFYLCYWVLCITAAGESFWPIIRGLRGSFLFPLCWVVLGLMAHFVFTSLLF